jgi:phage baseplate assembly protein W
MTDLPHFTVPFQFVSSGPGAVVAAVAEQESTDEIASCCEVVIRTVQGQRTSMPEFGRPEYEFNSDPEWVRTSLAGALLEFEPRVQSLIEAAPDASNAETQIVRAILAPSDQQESEVE